MSKYIYDKVTGKKYELREVESKDRTAESYLAAILVFNSPGLLITKLLNIEWYYSFIFSALFITAIYLMYKKINIGASVLKFFQTESQKEFWKFIWIMLSIFSLLAFFLLWCFSLPS